MIRLMTLYLVTLFLLIICCVYVYISRRKTQQVRLGLGKGIIVMFCTTDILDHFPKYAIDINRKYAQYHGYDFALETEPFESGLSSHAWNKIALLLKYLPVYDWAFYIDCDAFFQNKSVPVEHLFTNESSFIMCTDEPNSNGLYACNGGTILARNTPETMQLLEIWWDLRHHPEYQVFAFEQKAMSDIVRKKYKIPEDIYRIIDIRGAEAFNSIYGNVKKALEKDRLPETYVVHLMATDNTVREQWLRKVSDTY